MIILEPKKINSIVNEIHDLWFDVEMVKKSYSDGIVEFHLAKKRASLEINSFEKVLIIKNAVNLEIIDSEKVDYYDINEVMFNSDEKVITITTGVPINIKIFIERFEIEVEG